MEAYRLSGVFFERASAATALHRRFTRGSFLWPQETYPGVVPIGAPLQGAIESCKLQHGLDGSCDYDLMDEEVQDDDLELEEELDLEEDESLVQETEEVDYEVLQELDDDDLEREELEHDELIELETYVSEGFGAVPASAVEIAGLETRKYGAAVSVGLGCVICMEDFAAGDELSAVPCSSRHEFHRSCLAQWLALSRLCPLCSHALPAEDDARDELDL